MVGDVGPDTDWREALDGVSSVVHLAALAGRSDDSPADLHRVNTLGTRALSRQAAEAGIRRFVFVSSLKVHGESNGEQPFSLKRPPAPDTDYGLSKWRAEQELNALAAASDMQTVILRIPMVYGPGLTSNFLKLPRWLDKGWPLPLGAITAPRSMLSLANMTDLVRFSLDSPAMAGGTFLAADSQSPALPDLLRALARHMGVTPNIWPVPVVLLKLGAVLLGRRELYRRLWQPLRLDAGEITRLTGWRPPQSLDDGLAAFAKWYRQNY